MHVTHRTSQEFRRTHPAALAAVCCEPKDADCCDDGECCGDSATGSCC